MDRSSGSGAPVSAGEVLSGICSAAATVLLAALALFWGAGTWDYPEAWCYLIAFTLWMVGGFVWLVACQPGLYKRRVDAGPGAEQSPLQKALVIAIFAAIFALFLVPALDHRYGWSHMNGPITLVALVGAMGGLFFTARVASHNEFIAATITVERTQTVITTGPYAVVRHPMYLGCVVWAGCTPIALGSWYAVMLMVPLLLLLVGRLVSEERYLRANLNGYSEYCAKVRSRLIPFLF